MKVVSQLILLFFLGSTSAEEIAAEDVDETSIVAPPTEIKLSISEALTKDEVVPDIIDKSPAVMAEVRYGSLAVVLGNVLEPEETTSEPPSITWPADAQQFYTLILIDPDSPTRKLAVLREFQHWLIGNIPGTDISKGDALIEYVGAGPSFGTGYHRYIFLIYQQPSKINFTEQHYSKSSKIGRLRFSTKKFAKKYKFGEPIAANYFLARHK